MLADFEREATLLSEFDHPNIGNPHSICTCSSLFSVSGLDSFGTLNPDPDPDPRNRKRPTKKLKIHNFLICLKSY
jgi:hypothetical protein